MIEVEWAPILCILNYLPLYEYISVSNFLTFMPESFSKTAMFHVSIKVVDYFV